MKVLLPGLLLLCGMPVAQAEMLSTGQVIGQGPVTAVKTIRSSGTIIAVDRDNRQVTVAHAEIPELGLPAMTSTFPAHDAAQIDRLYAHQLVHFTLDGSGRILAIHPIP